MVFCVFLGLIVPSTILSGRSRSAMLENPTDKVQERRDSNPGLLGEKRERYLCAMPPPNNNYYVTIKTSHLNPLGGNCLSWSPFLRAFAGLKLVLMASVPGKGNSIRLYHL